MCPRSPEPTSSTPGPRSRRSPTTPRARASCVGRSRDAGRRRRGAEARWKARPVVASRIGGIQEQIVHGDSGVLLDDPRDLAAYGAAVTALLADREAAERMGGRARDRVRERFLSVRSLLDYLAVIRRVLAAERQDAVAL